MKASPAARPSPPTRAALEPALRAVLSHPAISAARRDPTRAHASAVFPVNALIVDVHPCGAQFKTVSNESAAYHPGTQPRVLHGKAQRAGAGSGLAAGFALPESQLKNHNPVGAASAHSNFDGSSVIALLSAGLHIAADLRAALDARFALETAA